jgi:hypothetical protein
MVYLAAITRRLTLATGILILPRRQTALSWKALGATHLIAEARGAKLRFPDAHLDVLRGFRETVNAEAA